MLNKQCVCGGRNPNCVACGGWGYIDKVSESRSAVGQGEIAPGHTRRKNNPTKRKQTHKTKTRPLLPAEIKCILCGELCLDISKHNCLKK